MDRGWGAASIRPLEPKRSLAKANPHTAGGAKWTEDGVRPQTPGCFQTSLTETPHPLNTQSRQLAVIRSRHAAFSRSAQAEPARGREADEEEGQIGGERRDEERDHTTGQPVGMQARG